MVADRIEIVDGLLSRLLGPLGSNHKVKRLNNFVKVRGHPSSLFSRERGVNSHILCIEFIERMSSNPP